MTQHTLANEYNLTPPRGGGGLPRHVGRVRRAGCGRTVVPPYCCGRCSPGGAILGGATVWRNVLAAAVRA
jgi:hypothetical protein